MIKGINHQVIEVTQTDNIYYERAFLVLRPQYADTEQSALEKEAKKMLSDFDTISSAKPKNVFTKHFLTALVYGSIGSLITFVIYSFL